MFHLEQRHDIEIVFVVWDYAAWLVLVHLQNGSTTYGHDRCQNYPFHLQALKCLKLLVIFEEAKLVHIPKIMKFSLLIFYMHVYLINHMIYL